LTASTGERGIPSQQR